MKVLFIGARLFDDVDFYLKEKNIESILTESNSNASNLDCANKYFIVPRGMDEPIRIAKEENVDGIISLIGIDDPLMDVALAKEKVENELKIPFIASNARTISISSDKIETKKFFIKNNINTSKFQILNSYNFEEFISSFESSMISSKNSLNNSKNNISENNISENNNLENNILENYNLKNYNLDFPVVFKQRSGQGGRDISIIQNIDEAKDYFYEFNEALCEEFIEGSEISIEVLCFNNSYMPLVPVYKGETSLNGLHPLNKVRCAPADVQGLNNEYVKKVAYLIAKELKAEGTIDIDFIFSKHDKVLYALEINTRPSGTRYLTAAATNIYPLTKLIDMVSGDFNINSLNEEMKDYFALEIPIGNFDDKQVSDKQVNSKEFNVKQVNDNQAIGKQVNGKEFNDNQFNGKKSNKSLKKFNKNSWVLHGPSNYERLTISAESKAEAKKLAKKLIGKRFYEFCLDEL
ncbi:ATP-grasp domain-containing protein [Methanobrevibacter arboriphilus]|nr:ATP-grasp domain-containing protein [Methanobrevibacter arboriphilus]